MVSLYPKNPQGPSNGRVNEPVLRRGVLVLKIATFEGSGFLGQMEFKRYISIGYKSPK